jgi:hypothetical protein
MYSRASLAFILLCLVFVERIRRRRRALQWIFEAFASVVLIRVWAVIRRAAVKLRGLAECRFINESTRKQPERSLQQRASEARLVILHDFRLHRRPRRRRHRHPERLSAGLQALQTKAPRHALCPTRLARSFRFGSCAKSELYDASLLFTLLF